MSFSLFKRKKINNDNVNYNVNDGVLDLDKEKNNYSNLNNININQNILNSKAINDEITKQTVKKIRKGIFFRRKKKIKNQELLEDKQNDIRSEVFQDEKLSKQELKAMKNDEYRAKKISDICHQILDSNKLVKEDIIKFTVLSDKISDMEKIKKASSERKAKIADIAAKLESLIIERQKYEKASDTMALDTAHYLILERNENNMLNEIRKLEEYEKEYLTIRSDLNKLEGERGNLKYEKSRLLTTKSLLKYFTRLLIGVSVILFTMFGILAYQGKLASFISVLITVGVITANVLYVVMALRKNSYRLEANRVKENKLIGLFNKEKIKYVNSVRLVEYVHKKFEVNNCRELKMYWDRYLKEKDRKFRYEKNTEMMSFQNKNFMDELNKLELTNSSAWKNEVKAFKNDKALENCEKRLQKEKNEMKKKIEQNKEIVKNGIRNINAIINSNSEYKEEIIAVMRECNLHI